MSTDSPLVTLDYPTTLHQGGANGRVTRVVVHGTVSPCKRGGAKANARYFQSPAAGGAAHYIVDPADIAQSVREAVSAHHAPPNTGSIGVELCDPQAGDYERWADEDHEAMLELAGRLVADICARHQLPIQWLSPSELLAGDAGITSHANVARAWHKTDHTDPGDAFPVEHFLALVRGTPAPTPTPAPVQEDDDMKIIIRPDGNAFLFAFGKLSVLDNEGVQHFAAAGTPIVDQLGDKSWSGLTKAHGQPVAG